MENLKITQIVSVSQDLLATICDLTVPTGTFQQISTMGICKTDNSPCKSEDVWIDLVDDNGDIVSDKPYTVSPYHAKWLLNEFFSCPPTIALRIRGDRSTF